MQGDQVSRGLQWLSFTYLRVHRPLLVRKIFKLTGGGYLVPLVLLFFEFEFLLTKLTRSKKCISIHQETVRIITYSVTNSINTKFMLPNKQSQSLRLNLIPRHNKVESKPISNSSSG